MIIMRVILGIFGLLSLCNLEGKCLENGKMTKLATLASWSPEEVME